VRTQAKFKQGCWAIGRGARRRQVSDRDGLNSSNDVTDQGRKNSPSAPSEEPRGIEKGIADADKKARTGTTQEPVRNTPAAGAWNDAASD
jgi:hypothetical protein